MDDVERVQARPAVLQEWARQATRDMNYQVDTDIYTEISGNVASGAQVDFAKANLPSDVASTTPSHRQALVDAILTQNKAMNDASWPMMGRFALVGTYVEWMLLKYLSEQGLDKWTGAMNAQSQAALTNMFGMEFIVDTRNMSPTLQTPNDPVILFGLRQSTYFAMQIRRTEMYRPERRFGDAVKGLCVYGTKVVRDTGLRLLKRGA